MKVFRLPEESQYLVIAGDWKLPSKHFMNMSDPLSRDEAANMLRDFGMPENEIETALRQARGLE